MSRPMLVLIAVGISLLIVAGYWFMPTGGHGQTGPSDYDLMVLSSKEAVDAVTSQGGKVKDVPNPLGKAWGANLSGLNITDKMLEEVKAIGPIAELDLSKSTVTDEQLGKMNNLGLTTVVWKLDLSNTAVTDAGLEKLDKMVFLQHLNLAGTKCTKAGADKFSRTRDAQQTTKLRNAKIKLN